MGVSDAPGLVVGEREGLSIGYDTSTGKIAIKVINHYSDPVLKALEVS